ncbi:MAG: polyhydroxyalkanoate synthesis regulator DNA-binding domain-containing protein [Kofleriaceae bacterium]
MAAVLIKKYGNRRLYDTGDSKYVTLEELAVKVRTGAELRVVDAQTGDDLTQATLAQIVLETGHAAKFLPVQLLTQMIRLSDDALAEFFSRYVTGALDLYLQAKRGVASMSAYNPLAQIPAAASEALARMWMGSPFPQAYPSPAQQPYAYSQPPYVAPPPPPDEPEPSNGRGSSPRISTQGEDVAAMRRELDELKQAIREGFAAKPPVPRKKRTKTT